MPARQDKLIRTADVFSVHVGNNRSATKWPDNPKRIYCSQRKEKLVAKESIFL